jgi:hypothetical protein
MIRDTTMYAPFMRQCFDGTYRPRRLRDLVWDFQGRVIHAGEHSSIEDSCAAMDMYKHAKNQWDDDAATHYHYLTCYYNHTASYSQLHYTADFEAKTDTALIR